MTMADLPLDVLNLFLLVVVSCVVALCGAGVVGVCWLCVHAPRRPTVSSRLGGT